MYLFGSKLVKNKPLILSLKLIFGLGKTNSFSILKKLGFCLNFKVQDLNKKQMFKLIKIIYSLQIFLASDLRKFRLLLFKKLLKIKLIKGFRKNDGLPIRGQRTRTNAKNAKKKFF